MKMPKAVHLPSGSWRVQVYCDGKMHSVTEKTEELAQATAVALRSGLIAQRDAPKGSLTLSEAIDEYIDVRKNVLSPATIRGYRVIQRNRLNGIIKKSVCKIDTDALQKEINNEAVSYSVKTIKNDIGLALAVLADYNQINTKRLRYPQRIKKEHAFLDEKQIFRLIAACEGNKSEIPILLAVWLGMRRSEILGLQWSAIDFLGGTISVESSMVKDEDGNYVLKKQMKNETSRRKLSCPSYISEKLKSYQPDENKRVGTVFPKQMDEIYESLKKICTDNDIPFVGVHGLRHTNASVMMSLGIVDKVAMARGGWATDDTMKSVYQHVFQSDQHGADKIMDAFFEALTPKFHTELHTKNSDV